MNLRDAVILSFLSDVLQILASAPKAVDDCSKSVFCLQQNMLQKIKSRFHHCCGYQHPSCRAVTLTRVNSWRAVTSLAWNRKPSARYTRIHLCKKMSASLCFQVFLSTNAMDIRSNQILASHSRSRKRLETAISKGSRVAKCSIRDCKSHSNTGFGTTNPKRSTPVQELEVSRKQKRSW